MLINIHKILTFFSMPGKTLICMHECVHILTHSSLCKLHTQHESRSWKPSTSRNKELPGAKVSLQVLLFFKSSMQLFFFLGVSGPIHSEGRPSWNVLLIFGLFPQLPTDGYQQTSTSSGHSGRRERSRSRSPHRNYKDSRSYSSSSSHRSEKKQEPRAPSPQKDRYQRQRNHVPK